MIYEYKCKICDKRKEVDVPIGKDKPPKCCREMMLKVYSSPIIKTDMGNSHQGYH